MAAAALVATVAAVVVPATGATAAPPLDPNMPSSWAKWTFHTGGNYNLVMDVTRSGGHGAVVQLYGDHGESNQIWFQEAAAEGGQFLHPGYDRWLCLGRTGTGWGTPVVVQGCDGSANQRWLITRLRYEYFLLKPYDDQGVCVDVPSSNFAQGADLQLWGCNESPAQYWQTGRCWAAACDGQWPDVTDCDTSGADEVRDVTRGDERLVLIRATGCHAFCCGTTPTEAPLRWSCPPRPARPAGRRCTAWTRTVRRSRHASRSTASRAIGSAPTCGGCELRSWRPGGTAPGHGARVLPPGRRSRSRAVDQLGHAAAPSGWCCSPASRTAATRRRSASRRSRPSSR
jgi:hypothetical protein